MADDTLRQKRTRALPAVGCEADAVATEERVSNAALRTPVAGTAAVVGFSGGSFVADERWGAVMLCVAHPDGERQRMRVEVPAGTRGSASVTIEKWDAPYSNGALLPGCGGGATCFADESPLSAADDLVGDWQVRSVKLERLETGYWRRVEEDLLVTRTAADAEALVTHQLPRGVSLRRADGVVEAGWLAAPGTRAVVSRMCDTDGSVVGVSWGVERFVAGD